MDGNGRWARQRGLPRIEGHRRGSDTVRRVLDAAREAGVHMVTLYAFSVENWRRPADEIEGLWSLLRAFLERHLPKLIKDRVRLRWIGRRSAVPTDLRERLEDAEARTAAFTEHACNVALDYGSRTEVVDAAKAWAADIAAGRSTIDQLDWTTFASYLYTSGLPDPDLLIRTSGETRISNFLMLQLAYAELHFTERLWPDFGKDDFFRAVDDFRRRERRYGLTGEQLARLDNSPPA